MQFRYKDSGFNFRNSVRLAKYRINSQYLFLLIVSILLISFASISSGTTTATDLDMIMDLTQIPESEAIKLFAADGTANSQFGTSVAVDGNYLVIGAPLAKDSTNRTVGAAYVFKKEGIGWAFQTRLNPPADGTIRGFGDSVAILGNTIFVGDPVSNESGVGSAGAVFVFLQNEDTWDLLQKLRAPDVTTSFRMGESLSADDNLLLVGSRDRAYIFLRTGFQWSLESILTDPLGRGRSDQFGISVDISGSTAVVGAPYAPGPAGQQGIACVFVRTAMTWSLQARLQASDTVSNDVFGAAVSIYHDTLVVGAYGDAHPLATGSVDFFERTGDTWMEKGKIYSTTAANASQFGTSVAMSQDRLLVGEPRPGIGAAHLFVRENGTWFLQSRFTTSDGQAADLVGSAVTFDGSQYFAGSPGARVVGVNTGAVQIFLQSPRSPDLQASNDTGPSDSDNVTNRQNLTFDVGGITVGATIQLLRDGTVVDTKNLSQAMTALTDVSAPANTSHVYTTRQIVNGETSSPSEPLTVTIDTIVPLITFNQRFSQADPTTGSSVEFDATFSENIIGFGPEDISLAGSTADISNVGIFAEPFVNPSLVTVTNIRSDGQFVRGSVVSGAAMDLAGNVTDVSTSTDNTVTLDNVRPSVTINQAVTQADPVATLPINFTVTFSEPVGGFTSSDISFAGSTSNLSGRIVTITGTGPVYNVAVSNINSNGQFIRVSIPSESVSDALGNINTASTSVDNMVTVDNVKPSVTINQASGQADPTNLSVVNYSVVFNEAVTGFDPSDISFSGSTVPTSSATITITGSGTTYNLMVGNLTSNGGIIRAAVVAGAATDALGNASFASTSGDNTITVDNVAPSVTINQASGQSDPASTQPVNFTVVFDENVSGFASSDVLLSGSTADVAAANILVSGSGTSYNVALSNVRSSGQIVATVVAGAATDISGNASRASTSSDNVITIVLRRADYDYDGDGKADLSVYRPSNGLWFVDRSRDGGFVTQLGGSTDKIAPADFDGDGKTDVAVYRPSQGGWYVMRSSTGVVDVTVFGAAVDLPVPGDYDGDGKADVAVFRPTDGTWYVLKSSGGTTINQFGANGDVPAPGDYDGDGKNDLVVWRPSNGVWFERRSNLGDLAIQFGASIDKIAPADYDGDGKTDVGIYRPSQGTWYSVNSSNGGYPVQVFGVAGDIPVPADYDGDGRSDIGVFRPSDRTWYLNRNTSGLSITQFGVNGDKPTENAFGN